MMRRIAPARAGAWSLRVGSDARGALKVTTSGAAALDGTRVTVRYGRGETVVADIGARRVDLHTFHRNQVPMYRREPRGEVRVANDVALLCDPCRPPPIREVEVLLALTGWTGIRSVFSHLVEGIELMLPGSTYRLEPTAGAVSCEWVGPDFRPAEDSDRESVLDAIQEAYGRWLDGDDEVCLALSGGYDSRFLLALLISLGKRIHCVHYTTHVREARLARQLARTAGASFELVDAARAADAGWGFLNRAGYITRWDGFFAPGALPAAGLYTRLRATHPDWGKILLDTGPLKGRMYDEADARAYWQGGIDADFAAAAAVFGDRRELLEEEALRRKDGVDAVLDRVDATASRPDVRTDLAYAFLSPHVGKLATRTTFLIENGMPLLGADRRIRELFAGLPEAHKRDRAFLEHGIARLAPRLLDHGFASSSMRGTEARFGGLARSRLTAPLVERVPARLVTYGRRRNERDWLEATGAGAALAALPAVAERLRRDPPTGTRSLVLAMIGNFIATITRDAGVDS